MCAPLIVSESAAQLLAYLVVKGNIAFVLYNVWFYTLFTRFKGVGMSLIYGKGLWSHFAQWLNNDRFDFNALKVGINFF